MLPSDAWHWLKLEYEAQRCDVKHLHSPTVALSHSTASACISCILSRSWNHHSHHRLNCPDPSAIPLCDLERWRVPEHAALPAQSKSKTNPAQDRQNDMIANGESDYQAERTAHQKNNGSERVRVSDSQVSCGGAKITGPSTTPPCCPL